MKTDATKRSGLLKAGRRGGRIQAGQETNETTFRATLLTRVEKARAEVVRHRNRGRTKPTTDCLLRFEMEPRMGFGGRAVTVARFNVRSRRRRVCQHRQDRFDQPLANLTLG